MKKTLNRLVKAGILFSLIILFMVFSAFWYFSSGLPDYKKLAKYEPSVSSRVYGDAGELIAEYAIQKRLFIPIESIPDVVINSFLSAEDKNFFCPPWCRCKRYNKSFFKKYSKYT